MNRTQVEVALPIGFTSASNCTLLLPNRALQCVLPPGTGPVSRVRVTVLGQASEVSVDGLAYAPPALSTLSPASWPTDLSALSITLTGSGFGLPSQSSVVRVTATGVGTCPGEAPVWVSGQVVTVRSDGEVTLEVRHPLAHVVRAWDLMVTVSGQNLTSGAVRVDTRAPSTPTPTFEETPPNGTRYFLVLTGKEYGPGVTPCPGDVQVTVDDQPCAVLTMLRVCAQLCSVWYWHLFMRWCALDGAECSCGRCTRCALPRSLLLLWCRRSARGVHASPG